MNNDNAPRRSGLSQVFFAFVGGAAAGAVAAYLTAPRAGTDSRRRLQAVADDAREAANRVPLALRKATEAARNAFNAALTDGNA